MRCRNCEEPIDVLDLCEICEMKERVIEPVEVMMCKRGHFMTKGAGKRGGWAVQRVPAQTASGLQGKASGSKGSGRRYTLDPGDSPSPRLRPAALEPEHAHGRRGTGRLRQH
jgi:hypothetical protein